MIYGYARISSKTQLRGNSLEEQYNLLSANGCSKIISEQYTGKTTDRPKLASLINTLQSGDTFMVTKLDRFARNVPEGIILVKQLFSQDVKVHILNIGLLENTYMGNFFLAVLLAVAELERNMIIEPISPTKIKYALDLLKEHSYKEVTEITGISKATLTRAKRKSTI